jgi:hypothetical protein
MTVDSSPPASADRSSSPVRSVEDVGELLRLDRLVDPAEQAGFVAAGEHLIAKLLVYRDAVTREDSEKRARQALGLALGLALRLALRQPLRLGAARSRSRQSRLAIKCELGATSASRPNIVQRKK